MKLKTVDDIVLSTKEEAENILVRLAVMVGSYNQATVMDLYILLGIDSRDFSDTNWGWTDVGEVDVIQVPKGYSLNLPKPEPLG